MSVNQMDKVEGVGTALVTPMQDNGAIDFEGIENLVKQQHAGNVDFLVVQGTTGESATLTAEEKQEVLDHFVKCNQLKLPIVLGVGGNNTRAVCDTFDDMNLEGVDAILSASPHYNKPTQEGIIAHFEELAKCSTKPIILYNVPGRTGSNMTAQTTLKLSRLDNIIGIKEASGDLDQIMTIINEKNDDFAVLSGDDALTLPILALGGRGVISVVSNAAPKEFSTLVHAANGGDFDEARKQQYALLNLMGELFAEGNPCGVKEALKHLNICGNTMRLPLVNVSASLSKDLSATIKTLKG